MQTGTQAIDRAAQLLVEVIESEQAPGVGELAESSGLPKSTASRLLRALERHGLVQRDGARGGFRAGPVLVRFAHRDAGPELIGLGDPHLDALAAASGETVNLAVPTPLGVDQLSQRDSRHYIGSTNWVGKRVPYHLTANGKVFLAWGAAASEHRTPAELAAIRARGYATAVDELEEGLTAVAAPVFDSGGRVIAALSISGPTIRLTRARIEELVPGLVQEAHALSGRLGHQDDQRGAA